MDCLWTLDFGRLRLSSHGKSEYEPACIGSYIGGIDGDGWLEVVWHHFKGGDDFYFQSPESDIHVGRLAVVVQWVRVKCAFLSISRFSHRVDKSCDLSLGCKVYDTNVVGAVEHYESGRAGFETGLA